MTLIVNRKGRNFVFAGCIGTREEGFTPFFIVRRGPDRYGEEVHRCDIDSDEWTTYGTMDEAFDAAMLAARTWLAQDELRDD